MRLSSSFVLLFSVPAALAAQQFTTRLENAAPNWKPTPAALTAQCDAAIARVRSQFIAAVSRPLAQRTLDNSLKPIELAITNFSQEVSPLTFLFQVAPDSAVRASSAACAQKVSNVYVEYGANPDIYATALSLQKGNAAKTAADRKLIALYIEFGKQAGAGLDPETRKRTTALFQRLNEIQREFGIALGADTTNISVDTAGLAGVPSSFVATLKRTPDGKYIVPVNEATYDFVMLSGTSRSTREQYYRANRLVGGSANVERLSKAMVLRDSLARLFGVPNWATYQLQTRTAKTPERVLTFLNDLDKTLLPKALAEKAERAALKKASGDTTEYKPWDYAFYSTLLRKQKYDLDEQEIREYFPVDQVVSGVLGIYSHLLGVRFREINPADAWAPLVREFEVIDSVTSKPLGVVYLDLYPRANKFNHFANWSLRNRILRPDGTTDRTVGAIVGNWPTPEPGKPALLSHGDVTIFFHEFGHLMAGTFATSRYVTNLGLRQDFVEAPSQMLENWMWRPEVLALVSRNVKTGQPLPKSLIDRMIAAKHMSDGLNWTGQIFYGLYDMTLASSPPSIDPTTTWLELQPLVTVNEPIKYGYPEASFGHLMSGYDAGYYGYLWSRVLAQDLFTRFNKEGLLSPVTGMAYRRIVLEPGGVKEPDELLQDFLGRPLNYDAFYEDIGISKRP